MKFFAGAVQLCLAVAQERDRARRAVGWVRDGSPVDDPREVEFARRKFCYDLVFAVIQALDRETAETAQHPDSAGNPALAAKRRAEAYDLVNASPDPVFQTCLYDFYITILGEPDRLLSIVGPQV
ncbi:hypothetical protein LTR53_019303, partial [Teratosphaeriaceae sp. CCFEE 6253]